MLTPLTGEIEAQSYLTELSNNREQAREGVWIECKPFSPKACFLAIILCFLHTKLPSVRQQIEMSVLAFGYQFTFLLPLGAETLSFMSWTFLFLHYANILYSNFGFFFLSLKIKN